MISHYILDILFVPNKGQGEPAHLPYSLQREIPASNRILFDKSLLHQCNIVEVGSDIPLEMLLYKYRNLYFTIV